MSGLRRSYSKELKNRVVKEIESGICSIREACESTGAQVSQVKLWLDEYGRFKPKRDVVEVVMKSEKEKIAALEKSLANAHLKLDFYESLINIAKKEHNLDLKKSTGTSGLEKPKVKRKRKSKRSVKS